MKFILTLSGIWTGLLLSVVLSTVYLSLKSHIPLRDLWAFIEKR